MRLARNSRSPRAQRGSSLLVSIVLLVVMTLIVISVIKSTTVNSRVAGNLQVQKEAEAAVQQVVETTITSNFQDVPVAASAVAANVSNAAASSAVGKYSVDVQKPKCLTVAPIKVLDLNAVDPGDQPCYTSSSNPTPGVAGGNSLCSNSQWDIQATAAPATGTGPSVTMHQGISVRVAAASTCPP